MLIAGGSGVVPLRSMLRHWTHSPRDVAVRLLYSSRRLGEVIYRDELLGYGELDQVEVRFALTREWPEDWSGHRGRIDQTLLEQVAGRAADEPRVYVCGPTGFVESAAGWLVGAGRRAGSGPSASARPGAERDDPSTATRSPVSCSSTSGAR